MKNLGYEILTKNEKQKCAKKDDLRTIVAFRPAPANGFPERVDITECANLCKYMNDCQYFYYNSKRYCELYNYCSYHEATNKGTTYHKKSIGEFQLFIGFVIKLNQKYVSIIVVDILCNIFDLLFLVSSTRVTITTTATTTESVKLTGNYLIKSIR